MRTRNKGSQKYGGRGRWSISVRALLPGALLMTLAMLMIGCQPSAQTNVVGYLLSQRFGTLNNPNAKLPPGAIEGRVLAEGRPVAGATVVVAERTARPHVAVTGADGRYRVDDLPPDEYVPAAVAPGYAETALAGALGVPGLVTVKSGGTSQVPDLTLLPHVVSPLPSDLATVVDLRQTGSFTASATFPEGAAAQVRTYEFDYNGVTVDSLRLYLPITATQDVTFPLALLVAPTAIDDWQQVSVAFAAMGHALVGISPMPARGVDAEAQAQDVRVALGLAQQGALGPEVGMNKPVAMGGSYSSAILARLVRAAGGQLAGWVTVGGLSNAFEGAERYYAGQLELPPNYSLLVPAFGLPNLYPLLFLRYSPVFVAREFPPTLIIHTAADHVLPIEQARQLEEALRAAGVPVETYYYEDVSHYLGIGENLTDAGKEMFYKIDEFMKTHSGEN